MKKMLAPLHGIVRLLRAPAHQERITDKKQIDREYRYWRIRILYSMFIGYACFYFTRKSFVFVMPAMMTDLHMTTTEIGVLSTLFYLAYGMSKFVSGMLSDRSNPRYFMAFGLMVTGVANILFGFSSSLPFLVCFWLLNAFFQGWGWPPCGRLLTHWYAQPERGTWWGIWNTSHNVGGALIPLIVAGSLFYYDSWRMAMYVPGAIAIVTGLVLINRLRGIPEEQGLPPIEEYKQGITLPESVRGTGLSIMQIFKQYILKNPSIWILALASVLVYVVRTAMNDWGAVYLHQQGYSIAAADTCVSFFEVGGFFGSLIAGWSSDFFFKGQRGQVNVLYSAGVVLALLAFAAIHGQHYILHAAALFAIGFLVFGPQMLIGVAAAELSHREAAGTATGFIGLFGYLGAALSGLPVGVVIQHYQWTGFFSFMGCCALGSVLLLLLLWKAGVSNIRHQSEDNAASSV